MSKACVKHEKLSDLFPKNKQEHSMNKRGKELFLVKMAKNERFKKSSIISMQKLLIKTKQAPPGHGSDRMPS